MKRHRNFIDLMIELVVTKRTVIEKLFTAGVVIAAALSLLVGTNYDLTEYLPDWAPVEQGIEVMEEHFGYPGSARLMIDEVSVYEAKVYKSQIEALEGVDSVTWLDSTASIYESEAFLNTHDIEDYYKDGHAVMDILFEGGDSDPKTYEALDKIREIFGDKGHLSGPSVENKTVEESLSREMPMILAFGVLAILGILAFTTTSWAEPFLFMATMGIAIIFNMGSNVIFGKISFLSDSVAKVIQLAVAMDYSIFLLHTFTREREAGLDVESAMTNALHEAVPSIMASGVTTIIGFAALALMKFTIGMDMGFVLAKGIIWSILTVLLLMPALIIRYHGWIEKTRHRSFVPPLGRFVALQFKLQHIIVAFALILAVPCYVAQGMNDFRYGNSAIGSGEGSRSYEDKKVTDELFGESNLLIVIVPDVSTVKEGKLSDRLEELSYVKSVTSMAGALPSGVPESFLPKSLTSQLHEGGYARLVVIVKSDTESERAFQCINEIKEITGEYYTEHTYFVGMTPATQDMKDIISSDYGAVNGISILGVALVILISFSSLSSVIAVMIPIELAIFVNMSLPYLYGQELVFLGYLMVSSMQLGATVDYSILMTNTYLSIREHEADKKKAAVEAVNQCILSILTSGTVLTVAGYGVYYLSSVKAIATMGQLIGRGGMFGMVLVLTLLPWLLNVFDARIMKDREKKEKKKKKRMERKMEMRRVKGLEPDIRPENREKKLEKAEEESRDPEGKRTLIEEKASDFHTNLENEERKREKKGLEIESGEKEMEKPEKRKEEP
ncbi:MMPL family transporter [Lachnospiraceae bacterium 62-35]